MLAPRVLLTDTNRWASPARIAIGLARAGCRVSAVCPRRGHPLLATRVVHQTFPYSGLRPLESLVAAIKATDPQIIVPCDDRGVQHLHELYARSRAQGASGAKLAELIEYSLGSAASYATISARCDVLRVAAEEGIRIPETRLLEKPDDFKSWQAEHEFPWVIKGDGTFGGKGVRIAHTRAQAENFYSEISRMFGGPRAFKRAIINRDGFWLRPWWIDYKPAISVQSYVQGSAANCAFVCWKGELLACTGVEVASSEGSTGPAIVVRVLDNPEMTLAAERIARRLGLSGFFGLDFVIEQETGNTYLIEMNPRCTPLTHLQLGKGRDLIEAFFAQLSGQPLREVPAVTQKDLIAYFPQAWHYKSELLQSSFQDIPQGEPDLVKDLLEPWPDRSLLYRAVSKLTAIAASVAVYRSSKHDAPQV